MPPNIIVKDKGGATPLTMQGVMAMATAENLLKDAVALLSEADPDEYADYAVAWFNVLLDETFEVNNRILRYKGTEQKDLLTEPQVIESLDDEIEYERELTAQAFKYGICKIIYLQENDPAMLGFYETKFANAVNEADRNVMVADEKTNNTSWW